MLPIYEMLTKEEQKLVPLFCFTGNCVLWNKNAPLRMRNTRKGRWLLSQPRSGARVWRAGLFVHL